MTTSDHQLKILDAAKRLGWDAANLSPAQYRHLSISVRSADELIRNAATAGASRLRTAIHLKVVSAEKSKDNAGICAGNRCGRYRLLKVLKGNPQPACDACNCAGKWLNSKWRDSTQHCPLVDPLTNAFYWDNRKEVELTEVAVDVNPNKCGDVKLGA